MMPNLVRLAATLVVLTTTCHAFSAVTPIIPTNLHHASNSNEQMPLRRGSTVALVTPFTADGHVDVAALRSLVDWHVASGTRNLCVLGTTAEASVLTRDERRLILREVVDRVKGQIPLLVGTGTIDPTTVVELTQEATDLGADAALVVTPYYVKPPQRCLVQHFVDLARATSVPLIAYNVPGRTGVDMTDASIARAAAQHDRIVGLKDATGNVDRVARVRRELEQCGIGADDFLLYSGDDATSLDFCLRGGDGCISVTANVAPAAMAELTQLALVGQDRDHADAARAALQMNEPLLPLHADLFCEANPIPTKWALYHMNQIASPYCRPPLGTLDPALEDTVRRALQHSGLAP